MQSLINHIQNYVSLNPEQAQQIIDGLSLKEYAQRDYLSREGQISKHLYFVKSGCLRMFCIDEKGVENTIQFALPNWWIGDYMSLTTSSLSEYFIEVVSDSQVLVIPFTQLERLSTAIPPFSHYMQLMMQKSLAAHQYRLQLMYTQSKEKIIIEFYTLFSSFAKLIPQYIIASYLAVTPEYLSKVLKNNPNL